MSKPAKTLADYLVISISPVLIMLLVGSLTFFLIDVFFRGPAIGSVRWVMFWFVMAVVLVSRIGIEQGTGPAMIYGLGLAAATWLYLVRIHPAFILGMILLAIVWWCAHKLTWDCTLIDAAEDASGGGLLESVGQEKKFRALGKAIKTASSRPGTPLEEPRSQPHSPGLWVVYFSLAALPLFGVGQMLLPGNDDAARHAGFTLLFVYVTAAIGLLLTTSFLGLRRYLRQRYLQMPSTIAFGWVRFGIGVAAFVLLGALLVPVPAPMMRGKNCIIRSTTGCDKPATMRCDSSSPGKGEGRPGNESQSPSRPRTPAQTPNLSPVPARPVPAKPDQKPDQFRARTRKHSNHRQATQEIYIVGSRFCFSQPSWFWQRSGFFANAICSSKLPGRFWPAWPDFSGICLNSAGREKRSRPFPNSRNPGRFAFAGFPESFPYRTNTPRGPTNNWFFIALKPCRHGRKNTALNRDQTELPANFAPR